MATLSSLPVGSKVKITHNIIGDIPCIVAAQNHDGYPSNSTTLITEKVILLRAFDAIEPNNSDSNRKNYGNNKYSVSNFDQWLNSTAAAGQWYSAKHSADQTPNSTSYVSRNPYDTDAGFLAGFDAAFVAALKDTTLKVALNTVTDGGSYESVTRKFFLPSRAELFGAAENSIMEGSLLSYFSANTNTVRIAQISAYAAQDNTNKGSSSVTAGSNWYYWLRTPYSSNSATVRNVYSDGSLINHYAYDGGGGVRPLCNLDSGISVSDSTDSDGCYSLVFDTPMTLRQSVEQHITDAYTAIGNKSGTIPTNKNLQNLAGAIGTISTGVDTSDGNIEPTTVLKGYKGYAKGVSVNGAIETYDGTVEDVPGYTDCLTFTGESSEFTLKATYQDWNGTLQWSTDHNTWTTLAGTEAMQSVGKKLYLRGKGNTKFGAGNGVRWQLSAKAGCSGNIQTLLDWENPPTSIPATYCYSRMFLGCTNLTTAPELPATTLAEYCYNDMFYGCTSLTTAPNLPATTLVGDCYYSMFLGCTNLTTAPELPATTLAEYCYYYMFNDCTSLTTAPTLSATTLAEYCYSNMFQGCTNLTTAPNLPATTLAEYCYCNMFYGCTSLTTAPNLPATTLVGDCYSGMFRGCTNLTTAPELPATTLVAYCYYAMFFGCTKLKINTSSGNNIFTCPTTIPDEAVTMMFGSTGGTFTGTPTAGNTYYYTL